MEYDSESLLLNQHLRSMMPFSIINDENIDDIESIHSSQQKHNERNQQNELNPSSFPTPTIKNFNSTGLIDITSTIRKSGGPLSRTYPWGKVLVENPDHCDFTLLKSALFASHFDDLKVTTREVYYEQWRTEKLIEVRNSVQAVSISQLPPSIARSASSASNVTAGSGMIYRKSMDVHHVLSSSKRGIESSGLRNQARLVEE